MQPDDSTRLRLVEVRAGAGALHVGGGFAAVLTAPAARSAVARRIATTVVGPRPADLDGTVEIAGRLVSARSLPSPLLPPSAPSLVGRETIRVHWSRACARRLAALAHEHSERVRALERAEDALAAARRRAEATCGSAREHLERGAQAREQVERLLGALDAYAPVPSRAAALAGAGDDPGDDPAVAAVSISASAEPNGAAPNADDGSEVRALRQQVEACESAVERIAAERARLLAAPAGDAWSCDADHAVLAVNDLLESYRRGDVLGGRLPLVIDGAFDTLPEPVVRAVIDALAAAGDVQPIVVTDDAAVFAIAGSAGAQASRWWEPQVPPERVVPGTGIVRPAGGLGR